MDGALIEAEPTAKPKKRSAFIKSRGLRFPKDRRFIRGQLRGALRDGKYEGKEAEAALSVVRDGDTVIELGAGIGFMSTLLARHRKLTALHAFEANPHLIPYIRSVHEANGLTNVHLTNAILGKRKGSAEFHVRANLLASSLTPPRGKDSAELVRVDVLNGNQVLKETGATVLVCDIEGAEAELLPELDLSGLRAAVIELHPQWIGPEGVNKVFAAFMAAGLAYYARGSTKKVVSFRRSW